MPDNPFDVLGLPVRMRMDRDGLERAYLSRASRLHPDIAKGDADAAGKIAELNEARATLMDAERRANAMLAALGGPGAEDDRTLPDGFLMEIMEVRERAEEAVSSGDEALREELRGWADGRRAEHIGRVSSLLDGEAPTPDDLVAARVELNAWRYIERMLEQVEEKRGA